MKKDYSEQLPENTRKQYSFFDMARSSIADVPLKFGNLADIQAYWLRTFVDGGMGAL
jgi:hypothetical protein